MRRWFRGLPAKVSAALRPAVLLPAVAPVALALLVSAAPVAAAGQSLPASGARGALHNRTWLEGSAARSIGSGYPGAYVALVGHGWGHGRGMGQWGALGYALAGESYSWLLDHYYGGTSAGSVGNPEIRVVMSGNDGNDVIVTSQSGFSISGIQFGPGDAALMHLTSTPNEWGIEESTSCAGGPSHSWAPVGSATDPVVVPSNPSPSATASEVLQLCQVGGNLWLRGDIQAWDYAGSQRTVNIVPLESYLRGVVPAEMPAYWGNLGGPGPGSEPWGFQALEAQAVAARSYMMADIGRFGYADICSSDACQAYLGVGVETSVTDAAVAATAGQVRVFANGAVAATEYSSSTGGYTAGGAFPAVVDAGDSVCVPGACNPHHTWRAVVQVSTIEGAYPQLGALDAVVVTNRNGLGDLGGRVEDLVLEGSAGNVVLTGDQFAYAFGLQSNWFAITSASSGGVDGYWEVASDGGIFSFGAAKFYGSMVGQASGAPVVGIAATADGGGYLLSTVAGSVANFGDSPQFGDVYTVGAGAGDRIVGLAASAGATSTSMVKM